MLAHYVLLLPKVVVFYGVSLFHRLTHWWMWKQPKAPFHFPDKEHLRFDYGVLQSWAREQLVPGPADTNVGPLYLTNPDHQCLRHGSLTWAYPVQDIFDGMENYIRDGVLIRGYASINPIQLDQYDAPPEMGLSMAHAFATAFKEGLTPHPFFVRHYLAMVDGLMEKDFKLSRDSDVSMRAASTGFDAIVALSLLFVAHRLSGDKKYTRRALRILFLRGYALLLVAPLTYLNDARRNYFIEHVALIGLRACLLTCPFSWLKPLLRHSFKYVHSISYSYLNPYFAALAHEVGVLPEKQRKRVLAIHADVDVVRASLYRNVSPTGVYPSDFSTHVANEFLFDDVKCGSIDQPESQQPHPITKVPLNGLTLARSLLILLGE